MNTKPNILILHADQHKQDCLGCYGNADVLTPNLDALAEDSVLYTNSFCPYPVCTPSRYSLLTGLYTHQHTGISNVATIPAGIKPFPKILSEASYKTKAVGKMHFTPTYLDVGFQEMELAEQCGLGRYDDDYHTYLRENGMADIVDLIDQVDKYRVDATAEYWDSHGAIASDLDQKDFTTQWIADRALSTVENWGDGGNMLMVGFIKPHHPFDPPKPWCDMYDPAKLALPDGWQEQCFPWDVAKHKGHFPHEQVTEELFRKILAYYYGSISEIDYHVGRIIDCLKTKGIYDNTLIIYTSDHGDYMGYHRLVGKNGYMYDPLMKVPLIIKYPGGNRGGAVSATMVNNVDISATVLNQAGCKAMPYMVGTDLSGGDTGKEYVFAESHGCTGYMVRSATRKLLLHKNSAESMFFDLEKDPLEKNNLFGNAAYKDEIDEFKAKLLNWILFEAPPCNSLNTDAPIISAANAVADNSPRRQLNHDYYFTKVSENKTYYRPARE